MPPRHIQTGSFPVCRPLSYVISGNLQRRHLDESQRSMVAAKVANMERGDNQHAQISATSQSEAARLLNVSRSSVQNAKSVLDRADPSIISAVELEYFRNSEVLNFANTPIGGVSPPWGDVPPMVKLCTLCKLCRGATRSRVRGERIKLLWAMPISCILRARAG